MLQGLLLLLLFLKCFFGQMFFDSRIVSNFKTKPHCLIYRMEKHEPSVYKIVIISLRTLKVFGIRCQSIFRKGIYPMYLLSHHWFFHRILIYLWHSRALRLPVDPPSIYDPIKHGTLCPTVQNEKCLEFWTPSIRFTNY